MYRIILFFCLFSSNLFAQLGFYPTNGAIGAGMGNCLVADQSNASIFSNQAGLAFLKSPSISVFGERRFFLGAINGFGAGYAHPTNSGTFLLKAQYFGYSAYNEQQIGVGYARKFLDNLSLGIQIQYQGFNIQDFGSKSTFSFVAGLQYLINNKFAIGFQIINPVQVKISENESLQTVYKTGFSWKASKLLTINVEAEKSQNYDLRIKGGINYKIMDQFYLRTGIMTQPAIYCFGAGFLITQKFQLDIAANYHQQLGFSPTFGVNYNF